MGGDGERERERRTERKEGEEGALQLQMPELGLHQNRLISSKLEKKGLRDLALTEDCWSFTDPGVIALLMDSTVGPARP